MTYLITYPQLVGKDMDSFTRIHFLEEVKILSISKPNNLIDSLNNLNLHTDISGLT